VEAHALHLEDVAALRQPVPPALTCATLEDLAPFAEGRVALEVVNFLWLIFSRRLCVVVDRADARTEVVEDLFPANVEVNSGGLGRITILRFPPDRAAITGVLALEVQVMLFDRFWRRLVREDAICAWSWTRPTSGPRPRSSAAGAGISS
jgi:hypothetical protein